MFSRYPRAFQILFWCQVCVGLGQAMLFAILPPAARELGLSPFQVSIIFVTSATIWVFVSPMWGRRSDVVGRRPVILIGLLGFAASMALLATMIEIGLAGLLPLAVVYPLMIASRSVFALVGSGTGPASQAYVADRTSRSDRSAGVALVSAAFGLGQALGPAVGAVLAVISVLAPVYFSAALAVMSALMIWVFLPEDGPPIEKGAGRPPKMSFRDRRILPFLLVAAAMQAVRATTVITLAFFLQDSLGLSAQETVQYAGVAFVALAVSGLFAQLVLVQRFNPSPALMMKVGVLLMLFAFVRLVTGVEFIDCLVALTFMGVGLGLVRPGFSAGASLSVGLEEQGSVAGLTSAIAVVGNIFGPLLGTILYELTPTGPYLLNAALMACTLVFVFANRRLRSIRV